MVTVTCKNSGVYVFNPSPLQLNNFTLPQTPTNYVAYMEG